jgi:glycosyltransferase involved in cell wall biosynthesis
MLLIYTLAYNAERTIRRTADSIFSQTHGDWRWYLVDNGSTDSTGASIREFAQRDKRIVPLANRTNRVFEPGNDWRDLVRAHDEDGFFCWIDADDVFKPDFFEKMFGFITANKLDIAVCGTDSIDAQTQEHIGTHVLEKNLILEKEGFSEHFIQYHKFMRSYWAKLFSLSIVRRFDWARICDQVCMPPSPYGWDTLFTQEMFRNAPRVGILAEPLFNYYFSEKSASRRWSEGRIESDRILYTLARDFLVFKCGVVSPQNEEFLLIVYMNAIHDTLNVLANAEMPEADKVSRALDVLSHEYTHRVAAWENIGARLGNVEVFTQRRRKVFSSAAAWLLSREDVPEEEIEAYCEAGVFVSAAAGNGDAWVFFRKLRARFLIDRNRVAEARKDVEELAELLPEDRDVMALGRQLMLSSGQIPPIPSQ